MYVAYKFISQYQAYKRLQNHQLLNQTASLYYKIFSPTRICILYLTDIPVDARIKVHELPTFTGYTLTKRSCWPSIDMQWDNELQLKLGQDLLNIPMPQSFPLSVKNYIILQDIATQVNYYGCLLIKRYGQDHYSNIRNDDTTNADA